MRLVDRFIDFTSWPTSRKAVAVSCLIMPTHVVIWLLFCLLVPADSPLIDVEAASRFQLIWIGTSLLTLAFVPAALAGREAPWTGYLGTITYATFSVAYAYLMGPPFVSGYVLVAGVAFFNMIMFDERIGWTLALYTSALVVLVGVLQWYGVLPVAPLLKERSIDPHFVHAGAFFTVLAAVVLTIIAGAAMCAVVVAAQRLQERRLRAAQTLIRRYVPSQVADAIIEGRSEQTDHLERRKLTIFFSDLVGFTDISEALEPEDLSRVLNEYFAAMSAIVHRHGGTLDELSGDAILVFFGAPHATDDRDHALRAVRMAIEMQDAVRTLNVAWRQAGIAEQLRVRMGINTGVVTVGNFGSPDRMKYAVLGRHVNLAARIQAQSEPGKVQLSQATWLLIQDHIPCIEKGEISFKGIHRPVPMYEAVVVT